MIRQHAKHSLALVAGLTLIGSAQADVPPSPLPPQQFKQAPKPEWGHVEGAVTNKADGKPIAGAEVILSLPLPGAYETARSDDKGAYRSPGLAAGDYHLHCRLGWSYYDYPSMVHVEDHKTTTVNCPLPPPRTPAPPPPPSTFMKWVPCKIVNSFRDETGTFVLYLNKGSESRLRVHQEGIIMNADTDVPLEDGSFKIVRVLGKGQSVAHSLRSVPFGKNLYCRINNLSR